MQKASLNSSPAVPGSAPVSAKAGGGRLLFLLALAASVGYICRVDVTVVAPRLMAELGLSQLEMGKVFSAFLLGYTLFQIPSGWLAGRASTRLLFGALAYCTYDLTNYATLRNWSLQITILDIVYGAAATAVAAAAATTVASWIGARVA